MEMGEQLASRAQPSLAPGVSGSAWCSQRSCRQSPFGKGRKLAGPAPAPFCQQPVRSYLAPSWPPSARAGGINFSAFHAKLLPSLSPTPPGLPLTGSGRSSPLSSDWGEGCSRLRAPAQEEEKYRPPPDCSRKWVTVMQKIRHGLWARLLPRSHRAGGRRRGRDYSSQPAPPTGSRAAARRRRLPARPGPAMAWRGAPFVAVRRLLRGPAGRRGIASCIDRKAPRRPAERGGAAPAPAGPWDGSGPRGSSLHPRRRCLRGGRRSGVKPGGRSVAWGLPSPPGG